MVGIWIGVMLVLRAGERSPIQTDIEQAGEKENPMVLRLARRGPVLG